MFPGEIFVDWTSTIPYGVLYLDVVERHPESEDPQKDRDLGTGDLHGSNCPSQLGSYLIFGTLT